MGHDTFAYRDQAHYDKDYTTRKDDPEVAYLRRNAPNSFNNTIYVALNCMDCYGGVSGYGVNRTFTKVQLLEAKRFIEKLRLMNFFIYANIPEAGMESAFDIELEFLNKCLAVPGESVVISFC